ncbi:hypothetical protein BC830DRAFT_646355 [Chytriomyces sp. MP71]|nr:hypothetical protein BC830DRAFT_646355 [Chytriomyces sp. MP71]
MLWPSKFSSIAILNSLHVKDDISMGRYPMSRVQAFWFGGLAMIFFTFRNTPHLCWAQCRSLAGCLETIPISRREKSRLLLGRPRLTLAWGASSLSHLTGPSFRLLLDPYSTLGYVEPDVGPVPVPLDCGADFCFLINCGGDLLVGSTSANGFALNAPFTYNKNGTQISNTEFLDASDHQILKLNVAFYDSKKPIYLTSFFAIQYNASFLVFLGELVILVPARYSNHLFSRDRPCCFVIWN